MAVISIGDGRLIEHEEGALKKPLPAVKLSTAIRHGIHGLIEWNKRKLAESSQIALNTKLPELPKTNDISREVANALWADAHRRAERDMTNITEDVVLHDAAQEALTAVLVTMRAPINQATKLSAAKTVLEYTMAKPTAKSEVTVSAAEKWLESIGE